MSKFETLINELSWVPLPFLSDLEWAVAKAMVNNPSLQDSLPTVGHVLSDLTITQHRLDRDKVARLANDGITDGGLCFQRNGKKYIWDGHHRYFAAQQIGKPTCQMKTFDMFDQNTLDGQDKEGMSVQDFASQLRCRVSTLLRAMDSSDRRVYEEKEMSKFGELFEADKDVLDYGISLQPKGQSRAGGVIWGIDPQLVNSDSKFVALANKKFGKQAGLDDWCFLMVKTSKYPQGVPQNNVIFDGKKFDKNHHPKHWDTRMARG